MIVSSGVRPDVQQAEPVARRFLLELAPEGELRSLYYRGDLIGKVSMHRFPELATGSLSGLELYAGVTMPGPNNVGDDHFTSLSLVDVVQDLIVASGVLSEEFRLSGLNCVALASLIVMLAPPRPPLSETPPGEVPF